MDINTLIYSECHNPVKVKIYNGITNRYEYKYVPCGECYHCKITRINEWVTRMVVQSNYSKYVYFGTLTYSSRRATACTYECLPCKSNFNSTGVLQDVPMILRKDHVQKFFKRLRKNTGLKLKYVYCGEYGSTYSRPHYHYIIWSNDPISTQDIKKAWRAPSIKNPDIKVLIGKVDHVDIKNAPRKITKDGKIESVYKYVCKYIQKKDFNFKDLKNYDNHKKNYHYWFKKQILLCIKHDSYIKEYGVKDFYDYQEMARPFFYCSKNPAIGYEYLQDHIGEFQKSNFKLFGLSGQYIFPLYFVRKTKELLCPIKVQSEINESTIGFSRVPKMASLLQNIEITRDIIENYDQVIRPFEYQNTDGGRYYLQSKSRLNDIELLKKNNSNYYIDQDCYEYLFNPKYLEFVNKETNVRYIFKGYHYTMVDNTTGEYYGEETLENVKNLLIYYYERVKPLLLLLMAKSEVSADKKASLINQLVIDGKINDEYSFDEYKSKCLENMMAKINENQRLYKMSKTLE